MTGSRAETSEEQPMDLAAQMRDLAENFLYDGDNDTPANAGYHRLYDLADAVGAALAAARMDAWAAARAAVERQTDLTELVHFDRPSDFRKGVLTCLVAIDEARKEG